MNFCRNCGNGLQPPPDPAPPPVESGRQPSRPTPPPGLRPAAVDAPPAVRCGSCGAQTPAGFRFCQMCGKPLGEAPVPGPAPSSQPVPAPAPAPPQPSAPVSQPAPMSQPAPVSQPSPAPAPTQASAPAPQPAPAPPSQPVPAPAPPQASSSAAAAAQPAAAAAEPAKTLLAPPPTFEASEPAAWGALVAVHRDGSDGARHPLGGDWVDLGRAARLAFDDRYLARSHVRLERRGDDVLLVPLDRFNGTYLRLRGDTSLGDGDVLLAGRAVLRFETVAPEEASPAPLVQGGVHFFGSPVRRPWGRLCELLPSGGVRDVRYLGAPEVILGREDGDILFRDDEFLSRRHAALRWNGSGCELADLGSSNGTFLRVREPTALRSGDHIRLGDQMFRFEPA